MTKPLSKGEELLCVGSIASRVVVWHLDWLNFVVDSIVHGSPRPEKGIKCFAIHPTDGPPFAAIKSFYDAFSA
jgi:hypothetical protein